MCQFHPVLSQVGDGAGRGGDVVWSLSLAQPGQGVLQGGEGPGSQGMAGVAARMVKLAPVSSFSPQFLSFFKDPPREWCA